MAGKKTKTVELENKMIATREFFDATTMQRYVKGAEVAGDVAKRASDYVEESKEVKEGD